MIRHLVGGGPERRDGAGRMMQRVWNALEITGMVIFYIAAFIAGWAVLDGGWSISGGDVAPFAFPAVLVLAGGAALTVVSSAMQRCACPECTERRERGDVW